MSEDKLTKSVKEIFTLGYIYNIAEYQRGYKWSEKQVRTLLEDIDNFDESIGKFYCLQHLTIKKNKYSEYDVIDGQQRLTTLIILLAYLGETSLLKNDNEYKIKYSIREESQKDLYSILESAYEKDFTSITNEFREQSQDTYHFCLAFSTIDNFFKNKEESYISNFKDKLLKHVKLIVNDLSSSELKSEIIFRNLNINKVPLTHYDFIRALFVTRVHENDLLEKEVKRIKIASSIDEMNMWWSREDVSNYFSYVYKGNYPNSIDILYSLYYETKKEEIDTKKYESLFEYLENYTNINEVFEEILVFHHTMMDWFEHREIYHLLGFIFTHRILDISTIFSKYKGRRRDFIFYLKKEIFHSLEELNIDGQLNIDKLLYDENNSLIVRILILMDIIKIINNPKFDFLDYKSFNKNNEDIEHIFSKTPNNDSTVKEAIYNIDYILENAKDLDKESKNKLKSFKVELNKKKKEETMKLSDLDLLYLYKETIMSYRPIHSIGNLVLLKTSINRSYQNYSFIYKRSTIIKHYNTIRNHTWTIFTKSFISTSKANNNLEEWSLDDIKESTNYIKNELKKFFALGEKENV